MTALSMVPRAVRVLALLALSVPDAGRANELQAPDLVRPSARAPDVPRARWDHRPGGALWTRAALSALQSHGAGLVAHVPADIDTWCPRYRDQDADGRAAFWVGFLSALAKHESTWRADAVGGGGRWYGLLQILPATARGHECRARSGAALSNGPANLSCAIRIMSVTVLRDGVLHGRDTRWRGASADWGPMRSSSKRQDMVGWLRRQTYCQPLDRLRPRSRPTRNR